MSTTLEKWRKIKTEDKILEKELSLKDSHLSSSFSRRLDFADSSFTGVMGAGTNKINIHTISAAAEAFACYLKEKNAKKIAISHDNRQNSKMYAEVAADIMANKGIEAFLWEDNALQPTPLLSYSIINQKLDGGVAITATSNPEKYNGFIPFGKNGSQLSFDETEKLNLIFEKIMPLRIKLKKTARKYMARETIDGYIASLSKVRLINNNNDIKIVYSPQHGAAANIASTVLKKSGAEVFIVDQQQNPEPSFKRSKSINPANGKSYKKAYMLAQKVKADAILLNDSDGGKAGLVVKHQRRYKYLDGNQAAAVYLNFKLTQMTLKGGIPKDSFIVTTHLSGNLAQSIAGKFGVKVYKSQKGFGNIAKVIEENKGSNFVFAYEESYGYIFNDKISKYRDGIQASVAFAEMVSYYKSQNSNPYKELKILYRDFGMHRNASQSKDISLKSYTKLIKKMKKIRKNTFKNKNVSAIEEFDKQGRNMLKVLFEDGSWFAVEYDKENNKITTTVNNVSAFNKKSFDYILFERLVFDWINDNTEDIIDKSFSWKTVIKYTIFSGIAVAIFVIVFFTVYSGSQSTNGGKVHLFSVATEIFNSNDRWLWLGMWLWRFVSMIISGWSMRRTLQIQGQKVKLRHLIISSWMSGIVSFLTPFAIGGDAVGYWYMRRKGIKRGPLLATFISDTLMYQIKFTLQTVLLVSIGWGVYRDIFGRNDPEASAALIWFFVGLSWTVISTAMIFLLTLHKRMQEFIIRNTTKFLEWFRWVHLNDPFSLASTVQYDFYVMREGMKIIWKPLIILELMFYRMVQLFVSPGSMLMIAGGWTNSAVAAGPYLAQIVIMDIVGTANSMSLTPGGSGTGEWLTVVTKQLVFDGSHQMLTNDLVTKNHVGVRTISSAADLMWKIISAWPWLVISGLVTIAVITYEITSTKYRVSRKNASLDKSVVALKNRPKVYLATFIVGIVAMFFIYFFVIIF